MPPHLRVRDARGEREVLCVGTVVVGRDPRCDISDADPELSRRHAEFVVTGETVRVRNLSTSNGIAVNGRDVVDQVLRDGDIVRIAGLTITLVTSGAVPAPEIPLPGDTDDHTIAMDPAAVQAAVRAAAGGLPGAAASPPPASPKPAAAQSDDDLTNKIDSPPPAAGWKPEGRVQAPPIGNRPSAGRRPPSARPPVTARTPRRSRTAREGTWARTVTTSALVLAFAVFTSTAVPLAWWQSQLLDAVAVDRASALVNWLAADVGAALRGGADVSTAADAVQAEANVIFAIVVGLDGRTIAPRFRAGERVDVVPGIGLAPARIARLQQGRADGVVYVARPIAGRDTARAAVAVVSFRPSGLPAGVGSNVVALGPSLLVALVVAALVAARIKRHTLHALARLNEDIELAISGQVDAIEDPLGAKPLRDVADSVNYLVARMHTGPEPVLTDDKSPRPRTFRGPAPRPAPAATRIAPSRPDPGPGVPHLVSNTPAANPAEVRIEADRGFKIEAVLGNAAGLLGQDGPVLIGRHVLDAIPPGRLNDALLDCLGALSTGGTEQRVVPRADGTRLRMAVSRTGAEAPVDIVITEERS